MKKIYLILLLIFSSVLFSCTSNVTLTLHMVMDNQYFTSSVIDVQIKKEAGSKLSTADLDVLFDRINDFYDFDEEDLKYQGYFKTIRNQNTANIKLTDYLVYTIAYVYSNNEFNDLVYFYDKYDKFKMDKTEYVIEKNTELYVQFVIFDDEEKLPKIYPYAGYLDYDWDYKEEDGHLVAYKVHYQSLLISYSVIYYAKVPEKLKEYNIPDNSLVIRDYTNGFYYFKPFTKDKIELLDIQKFYFMYRGHTGYRNLEQTTHQSFRVGDEVNNDVIVKEAIDLYNFKDASFPYSTNKNIVFHVEHKNNKYTYQPAYVKYTLEKLN